MSQTWFSSDFHGFHKNICRGTSTWGTRDVGPVSGIHGIQNTRNFATVDEMNEALWKGINDVVDKDDTLYVLGDWTFDGVKRIWEFRKAIKCRNIHLIFGNHDEHIEANKVLPNCHTDKDDWFTIHDGPNKSSKCWDTHAKDLFASADYYKHVAFGKQEIIMSHYAMRVWNRSHHGAIHLYGHSHDSLDRDGTEWGKSMDVGIDSAFRRFGVYRPFSLDEILSIMSKREVLILDHHNPTTT